MRHPAKLSNIFGHTELLQLTSYGKTIGCRSLGVATAGIKSLQFEMIEEK